jgi:hypothetical protein
MAAAKAHHRINHPGPQQVGFETVRCSVTYVDRHHAAIEF